MKLALPNPQGAFFAFTAAMREEGLEASRASPRGRMLLPVHRGQSDRVQRMINFIQPGSYLRPHLHPLEGASESIVVLEGRFGFLLFEPSGAISAIHEMGPGDFIDIVPRTWHSVVALAPDTIIGEFKRGPYSEQDKVFAEWAPEEGSSEAPAYLRMMESRFRTDSDAVASGPTG